MSDLISRSKLIEEINELLKSPYANQQQFGAERRETIEIVRDLCVKNQPTAYDIEKVVDELEENSFELGNDSIPISYVRLIRAIKIVKQGSISDDVCEWKFEETTGITWHCNNECTTYNPSYVKNLKIILDDFECKCPYCSKKIKVVE